jgi:sugar phosphate isomerase/epimerase
MKYIMFTKHLEGLDLAGIAGALNSVGVEGADLCVRPGYPVNPENIQTALPEAAQKLADEGLSIPMVTAPGDLTRPDLEYADEFYASCGEVGVKHIKLGYWAWNREQHYWDLVSEARKYLEGFQKLSEEHGVQTVVHTHSGTNMGLNSCAVMDLVQGMDASLVGVFLDTGHLSLCGEPITMALDIVRDYLSVMAFKDMIWEKRTVGGEAVWKSRVVPMGQGYVHWSEVLRSLEAINFDGPVSFHSEYSGQPVKRVVELARTDVEFVDVTLNGEEPAL